MKLAARTKQQRAADLVHGRVAARDVVLCDTVYLCDTGEVIAYIVGRLHAQNFFKIYKGLQKAVQSNTSTGTNIGM